MKVKLDLIYNNGFKWQVDNNLSVKGYAWYNNEYYEGITLLDLVNRNISVLGINMDSFLVKTDGVFSFIYFTEDYLLIYSDKTRFSPVFYRLEEQSINISDEPLKIAPYPNIIDDLSANEFQKTGYVTSDKTLIKGVNQVKPSEFLIFKDCSFSSKELFSYRVKSDEIKEYQDPGRELKIRIDNAFDKLMHTLKDKTPLVPLSGGYDSRLIACKLKEAGFNNTICFTYGRPTNEVKLSREVAKRLGFKWYFIDYSTLYKDKDIFSNEEFNEYYRYASRYTSMFYLQEFPAVQQLKQQGILPENSVFIPGHSGDLLGGSQFIKVFSPNLKANKIISQIIKTKYIFYPLTNKESDLYAEQIKKQIGEVSEFLPYSVFEDWDIKEKISKFIINSSQVFSFFGYEVRFPFWDNELIDFFRYLPAKHKLNKKLYDEILVNEYFKPNNIVLEQELNPTKVQVAFQSIKNKIKPVLPGIVKKYLVDKNDWSCYKEMSKTLLDEIPNQSRKFLPFANYNSVLVNWYLNEVMKKQP